MLKDISKNRPDRQLERNLIFLAYSIMLMSLSIFALFVYPTHRYYIGSGVVAFSLLCILITIRILKVSESAIGFGSLAAEILNDKNKYHRIDNSEGKIILVNKEALEYFKDKGVLEFLEKNIIDTNANKLDLQKLSSAVSKLQSTTVRLSINPTKNSVFVAEEWLRVSVKPIYLNKTDIFEGEYSLKKIQKETYIYWTIENITSYKNMEQVFQSEMSLLHNFLDFMPVGLYTHDGDGNIEYINNTLADYLKIDKNKVLGKKIDLLIAYKPEQLYSETGFFDGNIILKSGKENKEVFVRQRNIRENGNIKTRGVVIWDLPNDEDLTNTLQNVSDKCEWIFDTAPIGVVFVDKKHKIFEVNRHTLNIFNKKEEELYGEKIVKYFKEDAKAKIQEAFDEYMKNNSHNYDFETTLTVAGEDKNIHVYIAPMSAHHSGQINEIEGAILYLLDITNKRNLEIQVAQAQKMQAFGQLAGGVAHDFNNLLTAVIGYCDLLIQRHGVGDPSFSDLVQLKQNANRAAGVARQLLAISRKQPLNPKIIDVTEAITEIDHLLSRITGEQIKLQINYATDLGYIRVDPVQFSQVMINLVINAKDAMNGKGNLTISTRLEYLTEAYRFGEDVVKPGDFVVISVTDTGCGISSENINRIFEPFFSTKKNVVGSGTGLGLAMVYGIVRQTEGFIKVHSEVGKGTTFEIYLPAYENNDVEDKIQEDNKEEIIRDKKGKATLMAVPKSININRDDKVILGMNVSRFDSQRKISQNFGDIKILFVEDEDAVRAVGARGLRQKGFDVTDCISAENALEHIDNNEKFDMLITDMMMPGMSGADLAKIIHSRYPEMIIILASGYSEEIARKELAGASEFNFMSKPYSIGDLYNKVMEVLTKK